MLAQGKDSKEDGGGRELLFEHISLSPDSLNGRFGFCRGDLLPDAADVPLYNGCPLPRLASERDAQQFFGRDVPPRIMEKIGDDL